MKIEKYNLDLLRIVQNFLCPIQQLFFCYQYKKQASNSKMPKRNCRKLNGKPRKFSQQPEKKYIQKQMPLQWKCGICSSLNDNNSPLCVQCYMGLHYYSYVNMHMFVASDTSFKEIYFAQKSIKSEMEDCESSENNQSMSDSQSSAGIDWVQSLLKDE